MQSIVSECVCVCVHKSYPSPCHEGRQEGISKAPHIINLGTRWDWSTSHPGCYTPGVNNPGTH